MFGHLYIIGTFFFRCERYSKENEEEINPCCMALFLRYTAVGATQSGIFFEKKLKAP